MRYRSTDWSLEILDGWSCEVNESCTSFFHLDEVGVFQVSSYRKDVEVTDEDLREFAGEIPLASVSLGMLSGFRTRFSDGDAFWTKWWLRAGHQMIHVTYNCDLDECGREDSEIKLMLQSLEPEMRPPP